MGFLKKLLVLVSALLVWATVANAAWFAEETRIGSIVSSHDSVGTATAVVIASADVVGGLYRFSICNDAVNSSTYLALGLDADVSDDGIRLAPGQCFVCENCKPSLLKLLRVEGQAASNGYSVQQYKN